MIAKQKNKEIATPQCFTHADVAPVLLRWYDAHKRDLPWRAREPDASLTAYHVWLSEIMLQQTTVGTVQSYYANFLAHWPTVFDLAQASQEDVLSAWAGLGYYARARNLHKTAKIIADQGGVFPSTEQDLKKFPGIGDYTAAAIAAIAFQKPANVVDGNVERVMARYNACDSDKKTLKKLAAAYVPETRAGDYAQALMDLGATVCTPRNPQCRICPLEASCSGKADPLRYPTVRKKTEIPLKKTYAFCVYDKEGRFLLRYRPQSGLLAGMLEFPSSPWIVGALPVLEDAVAAHFPQLKKSKKCILNGNVHHTFTHLQLEVTVVLVEFSQAVLFPEAIFLTAAQARKKALPTLMKKILSKAFESLPTG